MSNVLVTGVSRGLGNEIARVLLERGSRVYGISRSMTREVAQLQEKHVDAFRYLQFDLAEPQLLKERVFTELMPYDLPIHGFVNNAAIAYDDVITNLRLERLEGMFRVNVYAPMMATKLVLRNMLFNRTAGSIVHVSSISVHTGYKGLSMYAATKGALEAFSKNTAREWGEAGIRSNCVVAGFMETEMSRTLSPEQRQRIYSRTCLKRATRQDSVTETVAFLLGEGSSSITGQNVFVDSGTI